MQQLKTDIDSVDIKLSEEVLKGIEEIRRDYPMPY
jgi:aryl-alcohol dehydrogenase-like predicted oxidoreductase